MTYWDGARWLPAGAPPPNGRTHVRRRLIGATAEAALITLLIFGLIAGTALAAKGGGGRAGYSGTLTATPDTVHAGDFFDVSGCGYDPALGNVVIGFTGGSWGSPLDAAGCFTITDIPALSGDSLAPGTYEVHAYQVVHKRWMATGGTVVTVVP